MRLAASIALAAAALSAVAAQAQTTNVKIGVLTDMSSLYADDNGAGSVAAVKSMHTAHTRNSGRKHSLNMSPVETPEATRSVCGNRAGISISPYTTAGNAIRHKLICQLTPSPGT